MTLTRVTVFIFADRFRQARLITHATLKSLLPASGLHRKCRLAGKFLAVALCTGVLATVSIGLCEDVDRIAPLKALSSDLATSYPELRAAMSYNIAMSPHAGADQLDRDIQTVQCHVREAPEPRSFLEQLGWLYVAKARASYDPGYYKLAEHCALALEVTDPKSPEALLLRGHVLISFHRFAEAEAIANELIGQRTLAFDHGLLGDALMEQGRLTQAVAAYQRMIDLRPDLQSYSRVANMRWLKGDLDGAIDVARLAARASSPLDRESRSWSLTRLALYYFQAGSLADAKAACDSALSFSPDYPAALLLQSRMLLAADRSGEAVAPAQRAVERNPLPEFQWALADTLRTAGRADEAAKVEATLKRTGAQNDARTFALFLATRGEQTELAVQLAERELKDRTDIFTYDALAWALTAAGRPDEAWPRMEKALAEGTVDARLFTHAGVLAAKLGRTAEAESWLAKARDLQRMLLPSERQQFVATLSASATSRDAPSISPPGTKTTSAHRDQFAEASTTDKNRRDQ
jgi:tetratricopeptide (TPR) repeat protein